MKLSTTLNAGWMLMNAHEIKDFDDVAQWTEEYFGGVFVGMIVDNQGEYVLYEDYKDLLEEYKELKYRIESLEK